MNTIHESSPMGFAIRCFLKTVLESPCHEDSKTPPTSYMLNLMKFLLRYLRLKTIDWQFFYFRMVIFLAWNCLKVICTCIWTWEQVMWRSVCLGLVLTMARGTASIQREPSNLGRSLWMVMAMTLWYQVSFNKIGKIGNIQCSAVREGIPSAYSFHSVHHRCLSHVFIANVCHKYSSFTVHIEHLTIWATANVI